MPSISDFISDNASSLAAKVRERMRPLHDPERDPVHPAISWLLRKPKGPQGHLITAATKALHRQRDVVWGLSMGCGKTYAAIATTHCYANSKPYAALVVCPPHLVEKWEREIRATIQGAVVIQVSCWREWLMLSRADKSLVKAPTWFITPISKAKLNAAWMPSFVKNKVSGMLTCPTCATVIDKKPHQPADIDWLCAMQRFCKKCKGSLWQYTGAEKIAPAKIVKRWMRGWFDMAILDEAHELRGDSTHAGEAAHHFVQAADKCQLLTGTLIAGKADDLRPTFFRLLPKRFLTRGFKWDSGQAFSEMYGKVETTIVQKQGRDNKFAAGRVSKKIRPGIMPQLYGDFVADRTLFLSLAEMGEALPEYKETTTPIDMPLDMATEYEKMCTALIAKFQELMQGDSPMLGYKFLPTIAEAILTYCDDPCGWGTICHKDEDKRLVPVYETKDITHAILPKEQALLDVLSENARQGKQSWVFSTRHATTDRLLSLLRSRFDTGHLTTAVPTTKREAWIATEGPKVQVMVSHPKLVETGLDLRGPKHNFTDLWFYSTGYQLMTVRQASARAWRIGQTKPCTTGFLYYKNTAQEKVIKHMARKLVAAQFVEGSISGGGLMSEADDASIELAIIKQLSESLNQRSRS
jgi:hypothetical protein